MSARVYSASDYAGVGFQNGDGLYYGYEVTTVDTEEWCFQARLTNRRGVQVVVTIPFSELGADDKELRWEPDACLLLGIARLMERRILTVAVANAAPPEPAFLPSTRDGER